MPCRSRRPAAQVASRPPSGIAPAGRRARLPDCPAVRSRHQQAAASDALDDSILESTDWKTRLNLSTMIFGKNFSRLVLIFAAMTLVSSVHGATRTVQVGQG